MILLQTNLVQVEEDQLAAIDENIKSIYRLIIFDKNHRNSDLLTRYLEAMEHLRDVLSIKNAQQEAQTHEEAIKYLEHLKHGLALIVDEVAGQRKLSSATDLFMLLRRIAPDAALRTPNHFRQNDIQFGYCKGADPGEIPGLIEQLFLALEEISHPVVRAIYLHHERVRIHPFPDGNGRLSRLAKNWLLMYDLYPPMFINNYADKKNYIRKLEGSFLSVEKSPTVLSKETSAFFADELQRLKASASFIHNRMLKDPELTFDSVNSRSLIN